MIRRARRPRPPVEALAGDRYRLNFAGEERALVERLVDQLRGLVTQAPDDDPRIRRLFPTAYHDDPERDSEYRRLMREELVASRLGSLETVAATLERDEVNEAELGALMRSVNAIRLVLGTLLDLDDDTDPTEVDPDDPLFAEYQLYFWLSWVLEHVVEALHSGLARS
jgi:hypothetical protein